MKKIIITFAIIVVVAIIIGAVISKLNNEKINGLKFSNTQEWADIYIEILEQPVSLVPNAINKIEIANPPINNSKQTYGEIKLLHSLVTERTVEKQQEIELEIDLANFTFGEKRLLEIFQGKPETANLIQTSVNEINTVVLSFKKKFDRVRPNFLDSSLTTAISVPEHPAYPSGHATQSFFIALILSDLDPSNKDTYKDSAYRIAHNREIAGVHYQSDSEAGRDLASQYFSLLSKTSWYKASLAEAQSEWE